MSRHPSLLELRHLPAPAKLNLLLHVTGRRADGYHLLETLFQFIDLADSIDLARRDDGRIELATPIPGVPAETDLTVRAASLLARASGTRFGVRIALRKRVPMGGGLGGGSSDAATVLLGLNRLWALDWPLERLAELGLALGADVPVFVRGDNAWATGVGERLVPVTLPPRWFVLAIPAQHVPTAAVFGAPELTRNTPPLTIDGLSRALSAESGRNDLQLVVEARYPRVAQALGLLRQAAGEVGLDPSLARMTGSGSCLFVPVPDHARGVALVERIPRRRNAQGLVVRVLRSLQKHPLRDWASGRVSRPSKAAGSQDSAAGSRAG
jgi:4-diphosphocytidyl-2-C-methyl-D-erythritol kinase